MLYINPPPTIPIGNYMSFSNEQNKRKMLKSQTRLHFVESPEGPVDVSELNLYLLIFYSIT